MNKILEKLKLTEKNHYLYTGIFIFLFLCLRYVALGFEYYYQLDDYIQYYNYPSSSDYIRLILEQGLLNSRPLAGISDLYVWAKFFDVMIVAVFIISAMYAASAVLFLKVFKKHFNLSMMFTVFYALMPFFYEGAYWVSASSRIVVGLFFVSLSAYYFERFVETKKAGSIIAFSVCQLLAFCFYEQILILSAVLTFLLTVLNFKGNKKALLLNLVTVLNGIIYFAITTYSKQFGTAAMASRMKIVWPEWNSYYFEYLRNVAEQIKTAFVTAPLAICTSGFIKGLGIMLKGSWWMLILVVIIFLRLQKKEKNTEEKKGRTIPAILCSICLIAAPISIFFCLENSYFSMRNILPSFVGVAILLDMIFVAVAKRSVIVKCIVPTVLVAVFFVASLSETYDYKKVNEFDNKIGEQITLVQNTGHIGKAAFLIKSEDKPQVTYKYHEHGIGVIESNWALHGFLVYLNNSEPLGDIVPIEINEGTYHERWEQELKIMSSFDNVFLWDAEGEEFVKLNKTNVSEAVCELTFADSGELFATTEEIDGMGHIYLNK